MIRRLLGLAAMLIAALASTAAYAARVSPMVVDVTPSGRGSIARVELVNPGALTFPVEVRVYRGDISEHGEVTLTPADDDFLVFPLQVIVPVQSQQVFRIQYVGDAELPTSQVYYVGIRQIPVEVVPGQTQVQVTVNFNVLVNVVPPGSRSEPVVESARPTVRGDVRGVEVRLANRGARYLAASSYAWRFTGQDAKGRPTRFNRTATEMSRAIGVGIVPPGRARVFFVPTDENLDGQSVQVTLDR